MCEKIKKSFKADCYYQKPNMETDKKYWFRMTVNECECGNFWTISATGEVIKLEREKECCQS